MSTRQERDGDTRQAPSETSYLWKLALLAIGALLGIGIVLRLVGVALPVWILVAMGAALVFVFLLPALGGRMHEPEGSPFKRAPWGV